MMREYSQVLIYANGILKWFLELVREQQKLLPPSTFFLFRYALYRIKKGYKMLPPYITPLTTTTTDD